MKRMFGHWKRRKMNNKGMTLIEIMIAVIILAVASVVILQGFASAAMYNKSAAVKQHSLTLAQSLMESMKSYSIDALDTQFASVTNADFKIYNLESSSIKTKSGTGNDRVYTLKGVKCNEAYYDAVITVSPYSYTPVAGDPAVTITENLVDVVNPNKYHDAIFRQKETDDFDLFYEDIKNAILAVEPDMVEPDSGSFGINGTNTVINSRVMNMDITANTVNISVTYNYTITGLEYNVMTLLDPADPTSAVPQPSATPFSGSITTTINFKDDYGQEYNNINTGAGLENIFFYYYPLYNATEFLNCASDYLIIQNNSGSVKNVFIYKQKSTRFGYETEYILAENHYDLELSCTAGTINLYHNVNDSIPGSGSPDLVSTYANITDMGLPWKEAVDASPLLYKVKVDVSEAGSSTVLCTLEGTTNIQ